MPAETPAKTSKCYIKKIIDRIKSLYIILVLVNKIIVFITTLILHTIIIIIILTILKHTDMFLNFFTKNQVIHVTS